jgi:hypothetical protein
MSVRTDRSAPVETSAVDASSLDFAGMNMNAPIDNHVTATIAAAQSADAALGEANTISTNSPHCPLKRTIAVNIRASLGDLCLRKQKSTWAPSVEAMRTIMQQKKFTDLSGTTEAHGDLKSVVLHSMTLANVSSDFDVPVGVKISGVDASTYSLTGEAFSTVVGPKSTSNVARTLQSDDVSLAYEFSRKFPGYTADNLTEKGVHEVAARRFVLVASDHPVVAAIGENASKLQMGEISMMPEGLVKISSEMYRSILPLVQSQVSSQIKVRDFSNAKISIQPADCASWSDVRTDLIAEAKSALRSELEAEIAGAAGPEEIEGLRASFNARERKIETNVDGKIYNFSATLDVAYNFLAK